MTKIQNSKRYDLEQRTQEFSAKIRLYVKILPKTLGNIEDIRQVIRSSGSMGANYREANEALSRKDFIMRIKIARKESKETEYWLVLLDSGGSPNLEEEKGELIQEAIELRKIFGSILEKSK